MTTFPPKSPCPTCGSDLTLPAAPPVQMEAVAWRISQGAGWNYFDALNERQLARFKELGWSIEPLYASPVPSSERDDIIEMCAKVADESVRQKCCGRGRIVCDGNGEPIGEDCCGEPDLEPMYPNEIAEAIRSLKSQPAQESGGS